MFEISPEGIPPKARWHSAAVVAGEGVHGIRGIIEGDFITPEAMRYVVIDENDRIVAWESFEKAGDLAERLDIQLVWGVHPELFLKLFAEIFCGKYVYLPYRGSAGYRCYHLAPVPDDLLEPPALM